MMMLCGCMLGVMLLQELPRLVVLVVVVVLPLLLQLPWCIIRNVGNPLIPLLRFGFDGLTLTLTLNSIYRVYIQYLYSIYTVYSIIIDLYKKIYISTCKAQYFGYFRLNLPRRGDFSAYLGSFR